LIDRLRTAFLESLADVAPGADCADPARIWAAVRGELQPGDAQALVDHALGCPSCMMAWRMAREVAADSAPAVAVRRAWRASHWAAVAAAVIAGVLIPVGVHEWRAPAPAVYREPGSGIVPLVSEGATLPRSGFLLRWAALGEDARYSVRVVRSDLGIVAQVDALEGQEYLVPAEKLAELPTGARLYWRVEAHLPDGSHVVSDTFSVRLE